VNPTEAPEPVPSATVVLLRDGPAGPEVYLQRRSRTVSRAGLWVFPGGRIDAADMDPVLDDWWTGPPVESWAVRLGSPIDEARGAVVAAVRETLEEAAVLLADGTPGVDEVAAARAALLQGTGLAAILPGLGVNLDAGLLRAWSYWITPVGEPRRYATRIFLAALPAGAAVAPHAAEADQERWLPAVYAAEDDELLMLPPTRCTVRDLASFDTVAAALAAGNDRPAAAILPVIEDGVVLLPWGERLVHPLLGGER
jgi:8-oxo-dGTP pyrophosphatase MutT (NUDIX family)